MIEMLGSIFGTYNGREIAKIEKIVDKIESLENEISALSDEALKNKTNEFKSRLENNETLDDILVESFAVVREAAVRTLNMRHYRVQLIGGIVLHQGRITEMRTGEGKTLVATLPVYLNALEGKGVHVVTVNDYLASRDKGWMGKVYEFLGLEVGCIISGMENDKRKKAYLADITYGTNNEFGFDYIRDNMVVRKENKVQRGFNYAIIDEVDSTLIDEARTPLIISGAGTKSTGLYSKADAFIRTLTKELDYTVEEKEKIVLLTDESGLGKAEKFFNVKNLSSPENMEINHHINQALRARTLMKKDVDYVVRDGEILIVDEFTGRLMSGRRYSNGLHQAIEAKEGQSIKKESQTLATITVQNFFRMYKKLAGMTGTAKTEEDEFKHIYGMDVLAIPTNKPVIRSDKDDVIYRTLKGKFDAIIGDIKRVHEKGQPVLVGTISIENSEYISKLLKKQGIIHEVLNAKYHHKEAEIVAQAGRYNAVTIATNMAGRGTDIVLGGNPEFVAKKAMKKDGFDDEMIEKATSKLDYHDDEVKNAKEVYHQYFDKLEKEFLEEKEKVIEAGGLHIIGTERHESRRIDNQLRGRSGRQGDIGSSQFFISFEDDLLRLFVSDKIREMVKNLGMDENTPVEASILSNSIEKAQKKVEGRNFGVRKHVLQYDDVINRQREIIYSERHKVLEGDDLKSNIVKMIEKIIDESISLYTTGSEYPEEWKLDLLESHLHSIFLPKGVIDKNNLDLTRDELREVIIRNAMETYNKKEEEFTPERMRDLERFILLRVVDNKWIDHIDAMSQLKQGIGLRAIGQQDPVVAYKKEGFDMFGEMINNIQDDTVKYLFGASIETNTKREKVAVISSSIKGDAQSATKNRSNQSKTKQNTFVRNDKKIRRNDPCPCGSGKKYKNCCGVKEND
ncbi:MAG: preprotein translocase subunit SecA [Bacillota bacterium]|nr:preprotein translocase subunit SecA [Bacillota bacterium]